MEEMDITTFDASKLRVRLEPPEAYFTRLLSSRAAQQHVSIRERLVAERELVREVWQDGDELWTWQIFPRGGAFGLVVLRKGELVRLWYRGFTL